METIEKYKVVDGTFYHADTDDKIIEVLERVRANGTRITLEYGDTETGQGWGDLYDITGTIGRSTGPVKVPLLIHNKRSMGGGAILDNCIVSIITSRGTGILYTHPTYKTGR